MKGIIAKINLLILIIITLCMFGCRNNNQKDDVSWINNGIAMIDENIGLNDDDFIKSIRLLYDNLQESDKAKITDYQKLVEAEKKIYNLKLEKGIIIEFDFSSNNIELLYEKDTDVVEKTILEEEKEVFLKKLNLLVVEKQNKSGADKSESIIISLDDEGIVYYRNSKYLIYNNSTYVIISGDLTFVFDYFK